jgi:IS5 family transposase
MTILKFRLWLDGKLLDRWFIDVVRKHGTQHRLLLKEGTIADASVIAAFWSTTNAEKQRDPYIHQTRRGNEVRFGVKLHIGGGDALALVHSFETTGASVHDVTHSDQLRHGDKQCVRDDDG